AGSRRVHGEWAPGWEAPSRRSSLFVEQRRQSVEIGNGHVIGGGVVPAVPDDHTGDSGGPSGGGVDLRTVADIHRIGSVDTELPERDLDAAGVRLERPDRGILGAQDDVEHL